MAEHFQVRVAARAYEVDSNGHVAGVALLQYAQHARWECLRAAGVDYDRLATLQVSPVSLEERIRFQQEVFAGEELCVSCSFSWEGGKTFGVEQRLFDIEGQLRAEVWNVGGLLDLRHRHLIADPGTCWRSVSQYPELLGL